jgi:hypothetical protein
MSQGQKHLVKCRCVLQQFKKLQNPPPHQFVVFSVVQDDGGVVVKQAQCNNCGVIHKVVDLCKSEIVSGKENAKSMVTIDDIRPSIHPNFANILEANSADLATWEAVQFAIENKRWGDAVVLTTEQDGNELHGKYLRIIGESLCKVESFTRSTGVIT